MRVMTRPGPSPTDVAELTTARVCVLAVAAAVATATSYVLQPELPAVARDVGSSLPVIGLVAALPIGGYLCGLALLVPLADRIRSHRLISGQLSVLAAGLLIAAIAATPLVLGAGLFVSGLCASTGAQMSSLAGRYSEPSRRGRAVGTVTAGISAGIVLGRILGGTLADWWGWRAMLLVFAAACLPLPVGTAAGGSLIDVAGWAGIGLTATAALTVAAGIVLLFGRTLAGAERGQEVAEGVEAVRADHGVAVGPGGGHPAHLGAVARGLGAGVGPDDPVGDPG
jgi:MFS family permease